jgi:hypothetical protein
MSDIERHRKPFVPDPDRIVYPVDYETSQRYARAQFDAEIRIEIGGQLTRRMIRKAGELEDEIRERARDAAHYTLMEHALVSYVGDSIGVRQGYMQPDQRWHRR